MIAVASLLAHVASEVGMKVPADPDEDYDKEEFIHFYVFEKVQLGASMPHPTAHHDNARLIAGLTLQEARTITYTELLDKGLAV